MDEAVRGLAEGLEARVALVALGGYGRGLLLPGSDIDLMVLHAERRAERVRTTAERLFYPLWDTGLPLGHAVRTVAECVAGAKERLDVACSLLDARLVWGDRSLAGRLEDEAGRALRRDPDGFLDRLAADAAERRERFGSCSAHLEPDLKEGSGGLRDLYAPAWAGRALVGTRGLEGLRSADLLRAREAEDLEDAEEFLVRLRSALHLATGRPSDRVHLELQPHLARDFGFEETVGLSAPDALMRTLFAHARQVEHLRDVVLERIRARGHGRGPAALEVEAPAGPDDVMEVFARSARKGTALSPGTLDALDAATAGEGLFPWTHRTREAFLAILRAGRRGTRALEAMDRAGLLARFLPDWEAVRCRPQRDPYHRFSVDVHLLEAAAEAAAVLETGGSGDPLAAQAVAAVEDRDALLLGAFLHDIGKTGQGRHVEVGGRVAARALERMGVPGPTREAALFLVREHLLLSDTAIRRDLADENLVLDAAARIGSSERLAMLYLLTLADARATGPHARTPWRRALVRELVAKIEHVLERGEMGPDRAAVLEERLDAAGRLLDVEHPEDADRHLARLPRGYVLAAPPEAIARHARLIGPPLQAAEVRTEARSGERAGTYDLTVVALDRPGLLAQIAGALALAGLNILASQAFTTEDGVALDLFVVETAFEGQADEERWRRFRTDLRKALEGRIALDHRVAEKRRHYPGPRVEVPLKVAVRNDASDFSTVVEVSTADRIGLLFDLARTFHELELDVHVARVATYGARVVDVFYVRDLEGRKAEDPERTAGIERAIRDRLDDT